jgi:TolB protein
MVNLKNKVMEQRNQTRQKIENPNTKLNQYSIEYLKINEPRLKFFSVLGFVASILIFFSACKEDEQIIDDEKPDGTVVLLKEGGQSPLWSPDGKKIAYLVDWEELYVMNSDGSDNLLLTSQIHERMIWSPSGMELAYHDYRGGPLAIYKIGVDGKNEVNLTGTGASLMDMHFSWSPDGKKIVYGVDAPNKVDMYIMNKDGTDNHKVDIPIDVFSPSYTPSGNRIMFNSLIDIERDLFLVRTDGSNLQRLESKNITVDHAEMKGDESKIYFSGRSGNNWDIYEVDPDGSNLKNLTKGVGTNHKPRISPDGKYIAFYSYRDYNEGLWIMNADGTNASRISKGTYRSFLPGSWSPDSRKLVFDDEVEGVQGVYVLTVK